MFPARVLTAQYPVDAVILWEPTARYPYQVFYPSRAKQSLGSPDEMAWLTQDFDLEDGKTYWLMGPATPLVGQVVSGALIGRGADFVHGFWKKVKGN